MNCDKFSTGHKWVWDNEQNLTLKERCKCGCTRIYIKSFRYEYIFLNEDPEIYQSGKGLNKKYYSKEWIEGEEE